MIVTLEIKIKDQNGNIIYEYADMFDLPCSDSGPIVIGPQNKYNAFPGLAKLPDGTLLVAFSVNTQHVTLPGTPLVLYRSTDNGKTWTGPLTIAQNPLRGYQSGTMLLTQAGTVLLNTTFYAGGAADAHLFRSNDGGLTWIGPLVLATNRASEGQGVQCSDGTIIMPLHDGVNSYCIRSNDDGQTWGRPILIANGPAAGRAYNETGFAISAGQAIAEVRADPPDNFFVVATSDDNGATWTTPGVTQRDISGRPGLLVTAQNAFLFGRSITGNNRGIYHSAPIGSDWGPQKNILESVNGWNNYLSAIEIAPGKIAIVTADEPGAQGGSISIVRFLIRDESEMIA